MVYLDKLGSLAALNQRLPRFVGIVKSFFFDLEYFGQKTCLEALGNFLHASFCFSHSCQSIFYILGGLGTFLLCCNLLICSGEEELKNVSTKKWLGILRLLLLLLENHINKI